jgi:protein Tex
VRDASEVVKVAQKVQVTVVEVDLARKRIALSMKTKPDFEKKTSSTGPGQGGGGDRRVGSGGTGGYSSGGNRPQQGGGGTRAQQGGGMGNPFGGNDWFSQASAKGKK